MVKTRIKAADFEDRLTLVEHLDELRNRIIVSGIVLVLACVGCFIFNDAILDIANHPLPNSSAQLITLSPTEPFLTTLTLVLYAGVIVTMPFLLYQVYAFILPALSPDERKVALPLMMMVPVLFILGVIFAYFVVVPAAVKFLLNFNDDQFNIQIRAREYYSFFALSLLSVGVLFQIPVGILAVTRLGITTPEALAKNRRYAILIIAVLAMLLPGTDPITMLISMVPLVILFEFSLILARWFNRNVGGPGGSDDDPDEPDEPDEPDAPDEPDEPDAPGEPDEPEPPAEPEPEAEPDDDGDADEPEDDDSPFHTAPESTDDPSAEPEDKTFGSPMLFDLQGKRKRVVQVIYLGLALLMGIGLVGLGIGGSANGGIFDALGIGGNSTSSDPQYDEEIDRANETLASDPKNQGALLTLVRYEFLEARASGESDPDTREFTPSAESIEHFENSVDAWERYLATKPAKPDDDRASLAYQAYSYTIDPSSPLGDDDLKRQTEAARIVADARPFYGNYLNLTFAAYIGGDDAVGAQAAKDATGVAADETQEKQVKQVVKQAKAVRKQILAERKQRNEAGGGGALGEGDEGSTVAPGGSDLLPPSTGELTPTP